MGFITSRILIGPGAAQALPAAETQLAAMNARGGSFLWWQASFAGGTIEITRGTVIDTIRITANGACTIVMDSGVVDVLSASAIQPVAYNSGVLYATADIATYNAPFVSINPAPALRKNPAKTSAGQFSGTLTYNNGFTGAVPFDAQPAGSFLVGQIPNPAVPPVPATIPNVIDNNLLAKKVMATSCPASIFTGRCRLYVQAMYGAPTYSPNGLVARPQPILYTPPGSPPRLHLAAYNDKDGSLGKVEITSSTGVWLDPATGKHWLFNPAGVVTVYPLRGSLCAEGMRKYLQATNLTYSTADKAHLEAYILSTCLPDMANAVTAAGAITTTGRPAGGYGWHWNFSGTGADCVFLSTYQQDLTHTAMISTQYHIAVTKTTVAGVTTWACSQSTVEGPVNWTTYRAGFCITEPNWDANFDQGKMTPKSTTLFACDAPFYCFYLGDVLQVARSTVIVHSSVFNTRTTSDGWGTDADSLTAGEHNGFGETLVVTANTEFKFACGGLTLDQLYLGRSDSGTRAEVAGKTLVANLDSLIYSSSLGPGTITWLTGYPSPYQPVIIPIAADQAIQTESSNGITFTHDYITSNTTNTYQSAAEIAIPYNDAEAIFMRGQTLRNFTRSSRVSKSWTTDSDFGSSQRYRYLGGSPPAYGPWSSYLNTFIFGNGNGPAHGTLVSGPTGLADQTSSDFVQNQSKLVCRAGLLDVTFAAISDFHDDTLETVGSSYAAQSGVSTTAPVAIADGYLTPRFGIGAGPAAGLPVIVGWV